MFLEAHRLLNFLEIFYQLKATQGGSELGANLLALASPKMAQPSSPMALSWAVGITMHSAPNKVVLIKCLTEFSQQKEKWQGYVRCYLLPAPLHVLFQD